MAEKQARRGQKVKLLYIIKILSELTDDEHPLSATEICKNLAYIYKNMPPLRLQQALSLNAGTRENLRHASALRLGSDGFYGSWLPPRTNRQLSGNTQTEPSSSQPFYHCQQCIMSAPKSQMFFLSETLFSFCTKNPCGNPLKNGKTAC